VAALDKRPHLVDARQRKTAKIVSAADSMTHHSTIRVLEFFSSATIGTKGRPTLSKLSKKRAKIFRRRVDFSTLLCLGGTDTSLFSDGDGLYLVRATTWRYMRELTTTTTTKPFHVFVPATTTHPKEPERRNVGKRSILRLSPPFYRNCAQRLRPSCRKESAKDNLSRQRIDARRRHEHWDRRKTTLLSTDPDIVPIVASADATSDHLAPCPMNDSKWIRRHARGGSYGSD
jgi:hypothetical protein